MAISKYLDVSSGYVTAGDMELLAQGKQCIASYAEGAFVYLPAMGRDGTFDDPDWRMALRDEGFSERFVDLLDYARRQRCDSARLDCDGDTGHQGLDWQE